MNLDGASSQFQNIENFILPTVFNVSGGATIFGGSAQSAWTIPTGTTVNFDHATLSGNSGANILVIDNQGVININGIQSTALFDTDLSNSNGGTIGGPGFLTLNFQGILQADNSVSVANIDLQGGILVANSFTHNGNLFWSSGQIVDPGAGTGLITNGSVNLTAGVLATDWLISPSSTVNWLGTDLDQLFISNATITNQGAFIINNTGGSAGTGRFLEKDFSGSVGAAFINQGALVLNGLNNSTIDFSQLSFTNDNGVIFIQAGIFDIGGALILDQANDVLMGSGTFNGNVDNQQGTVTPGRNNFFGNIFQAGTLTINGNYTQGANGRLVIDLDATAQGLQFDSLNVAQTFTAGGDLDFLLINGSSAIAVASLVDQSFRPLQFNAFGGSFAQVNIPAGLNFNLGPNGLINITAANNFVETLSNQLQVLFTKDNLDYQQIALALQFLDQRIRFFGEEEDGKPRAPRLICR